MPNRLAGVHFIQDPPFNAGYSERMRDLQSRDAADAARERDQFAIDEARRQAAEAQAVDKAYRDVAAARTSPVGPAPLSAASPIEPLAVGQGQAAPIAPAPVTSRSSPVLATQTAGVLSRTPGGGKAAMAMLELQQRQQDGWEEMAIKALGTGDLETFKFYQSKSGLQLPPEAMRSAESRANFARAMDIAKTNYKDDPAQGQAFAQTFMGTPGDFQAKLMAASERAGPPRSKPNWTATIAAQSGGKSGGPASVFKQKQEGWLSVHPGDQQGALDYAGGRKEMSPQDEQKAAANIAKAEFSGAFNVKPDQMQGRIREIIAGWRSTSSAPMPAPASGAAAVSVAPPIQQSPPETSQASAPSPQRPAALAGRKLLWSPQRQAFRDANTGEIFDANGNPAGGK